VVDRVAGAPARLFVSAGSSVLRRRSVSGAAELADAVLLSTADDDLHVRVDLVNGLAKRMGIFRGALDPMTKSFEIGKDGEELTLLSQAEITSSFTLNGTSESEATMRVTYAATATEDRKLIVVEPKELSPDSQVRVFFGKSDRMIQRRVISTSRDHTIHLVFDLDGLSANALLTFCGPSPVWGPPVIKLSNGAEIALTTVEGSQKCARPSVNDAAATISPSLSDESLVAGHQFFCF
jgi:hypothetical protein